MSRSRNPLHTLRDIVGEVHVEYTVNNRRYEVPKEMEVLPEYLGEIEFEMFQYCDNVFDIILVLENYYPHLPVGEASTHIKRVLEGLDVLPTPKMYSHIGRAKNNKINLACM